MCNDRISQNVRFANTYRQFFWITVEEQQHGWPKRP